jgi:hypothetical protein
VATKSDSCGLCASGENMCVREREREARTSDLVDARGRVVPHDLLGGDVVGSHSARARRRLALRI